MVSLKSFVSRNVDHIFLYSSFFYICAFNGYLERTSIRGFILMLTDGQVSKACLDEQMIFKNGIILNYSTFF